MDVSLQVPGAAELPDDIEALFYRVAQEAIRNARSHGEATEVEICVETDPHQAILSVVDNGRGFSPEAGGERQRESHFGLRLMRDLVDHAGGRLAVVSSPGQGASIRLTVPLR
ncbi:MAG: ATP-binding protein [Actinomycetota bacterium]|nr:ATP-binding protein [Actinomycetota bacterium]